tara:strand:+ start:448 stop:675 length:228 start_codon:yes stop_codon:yes gene_type:complete
MTIQDIKDYCIKVDNINETGTSKEIELYYKDISFKKLLHIYIEYNGLKCYRKEEPQDYKETYSIDMISLLQILNN